MILICGAIGCTIAASVSGFTVNIYRLQLIKNVKMGFFISIVIDSTLYT
ncbi:hypothetical protein [Ehrlichia ruminantium]|nr:hypothetical protein [Ehrlichia ruminantium]